MAINVADNFSYKGGKPLDSRIQYNTVSDMVSTPVADLYDGCLAYSKDTKKNYQYDSANTVDPTLGKWRELQTGGGGTDYTAGNGIDITNNVISADAAPSEDMSEIVSPLPSIPTRCHKYSTEEQVVGEWIDGKPLYEKTLTDFSHTYNQNTEYSISVGSNIDKIMVQSGYIDIGSGNALLPLNFILTQVSNSIYCFPELINHTATLKLKSVGWSFLGYVITVQYTKTTD